MCGLRGTHGANDRIFLAHTNRHMKAQHKKKVTDYYITEGLDEQEESDMKERKKETARMQSGKLVCIYESGRH